MTTEQQRIAIAKFYGFTAIKRELTGVLSGVGPKDQNGVRWDKEIPNYPADLNAMHEAEKRLNESQYQRYKDELTAIRWRAAAGESEHEFDYSCESATAPQRSEAMCRTIGKWVE